MIKKFLFYICFKYFRFKFLSLIGNSNKKIYIFDLDNTIANTWVSYHQSYGSNKSRLKNLSVFIGMKNLISSIDKTKYIVIVLTAREYWYYRITKKWLKQNELDVDGLILVSKPSEKVLLLSHVAAECEYYDDMSYNHENYDIKYYRDEISDIKKLPNVLYHNYDEIKKINKIE